MVYSHCWRKCLRCVDMRGPHRCSLGRSLPPCFRFSGCSESTKMDALSAPGLLNAKYAAICGDRVENSHLSTKPGQVQASLSLSIFRQEGFPSPVECRRSTDSSWILASPLDLPFQRVVASSHSEF